MSAIGLANTTTKQIAATAGCSEAALYKHFRDKEEIFLTVMRERMPTDFVTTLAALPSRTGEGAVRDTLLDVATRAVSFYRQIIPMMSGVFAEPDLLARHQDALRRAGLGPHLANVALAAYLRAEQELGRLPGDASPDALAALLLGACFQRAFLIRFVGEHVATEPPDQFAASIVATLPLG
jgi:AcrR family transcriptional regulator